MKLLTLTILFEFIFGNLIAQITFQRTYGSTGWESGYSVQQTSDGGYIISADTRPLASNTGKVYLIKTNEYGDTLWTKTFGGAYGDAGYCVQQTADGGYIVTGTSVAKVYLVKTDANGNKTWEKTFQNGDEDKGYSVIQTSDGGYIIVGRTKYMASGQTTYLIKTNSNGDSLWTKTFGMTMFPSGGYGIIQTDDNGYVITGFLDNGDFFGDAYLLKTNSSGTTQWLKTFDVSGTRDESGNSVYQTNDGGFIIAGSTQGGGTSSNIFLIRTDTNGDTIWTKVLSSPLNGVGTSVQQTNDGGFIVTGGTTLTGSNNIFLIKTDVNGDKLWSKTFGGSNTDYGKSVKQTDDGGFIIVGYTNSYGKGEWDVYLIKTDANGNASDLTSIPDFPNNYLTVPSPNPFTTSTTITIPKLHWNEQNLPSIAIYDMFGREMNVSSQMNLSSEQLEVIISRSGLPSGIYFFKLTRDNEVIGSGKLIGL